jgi:hypothetical protein
MLKRIREWTSPEPARTALDRFEQCAEQLLFGDGVKTTQRFIQNQHFRPPRQSQQDA